MLAPVKGRRDWPAIVSLGFNTDRNGKRGYKGLLWAQGVWLFFAYERPPGYAAHRDLAQDRLVQWERRAFPFLAIHFAAKQLVPNQSLRQTHREWHIQEPAGTQELLAA